MNNVSLFTRRKCQSAFCKINGHIQWNIWFNFFSVEHQTDIEENCIRNAYSRIRSHFSINPLNTFIDLLNGRFSELPIPVLIRGDFLYHKLCSDWNVSFLGVVDCDLITILIDREGARLVLDYDHSKY